MFLPVVFDAFCFVGFSPFRLSSSLPYASLFRRFADVLIFSVGAAGHTYPNDFVKNFDPYCLTVRSNQCLLIEKVRRKSSNSPTGKHFHSRGKGLLV